ncbi:MAG: tetratricopeptide repeat protein, partial [Porphyromonadaceae bacterium]|nr:tetratricopeptide repeat protein [Porphyromonadaceae bacterium]
MQKSYEDNFTHLLYMHPVSAYGVPSDPQPQGDFSRSLEKSQKAIRQHSMQKPPKHNRKKMDDPKYREFIKRGEFNPFIHNAWVLMGESQFYQGDFLGALATFIYITRHFPWNTSLMADTRIWIARSYLELGWLYEAEDILLKVPKEYTLTSKQKRWYATVYADYLIRCGEYASAIPYLKEALKMADGHAQKIRMTFLLAQLQAKTGDKAGAYHSYQAVI